MSDNIKWEKQEEEKNLKEYIKLIPVTIWTVKIRWYLKSKQTGPNIFLGPTKKEEQSSTSAVEGRAVRDPGPRSGPSQR